MNIDQVIVALDVDTFNEAINLLDNLPDIKYFKVGWQLFANEGIGILQDLGEYDVNVFLDLKIDDIPNTVENAVRILTQHECVKFFSFQGDQATLQACRDGCVNVDTKFLFVPTLSSRSRHLDILRQSVVANTLGAGADGVVVSGYDHIRFVKARYDSLVVAPGIRCNTDDQDHVQTTTPQEAIDCGADYIVIGREITTAADPQKALNSIL